MRRLLTRHLTYLCNRSIYHHAFHSFTLTPSIITSFYIFTMGIPISHPIRLVRRKRSNSTKRSKSSSTPSQNSFETEISQFYGGSSVLDAFRYIEGRRYHNSDTRY